MTATLDPVNLNDLRHRISGSVFQPGDPEWAREVACFNARIQHTPDVVVVATCTDDVCAAIRFAAEHAMAVSVQATGHGAEAPIEHGLLITTHGMDQLRIDAEQHTATLGAGVRWRAVIDAAAPFGLAPLSGSTSQVGAVGYTVGGGLPVLGRQFGWCADRVRRLRLVTPDGTVHDLDETDTTGLFWGVRGGKHNLGIVTEMTVELVEVSHFWGGGVFWSTERIPAVLRAFVHQCQNISQSTALSLAVLRLPPVPEVPEILRSGPVAHLRICHLGGSEEVAPLIASMRAVAPPLLEMLGDMPYTAIDDVHGDPHDPVPFCERSLLLDHVPDAAVDTLLELAGPDVDSPLLVCELRRLGGALAERPRIPHAVGPVDAAFSLLGIAPAPPELLDTARAGVDQLVDRMSPWSSGQTLLNVHGEPGSEQDRARPWSPDSHQRLVALRRQVDPSGVLAFGHVV